MAILNQSCCGISLQMGTIIIAVLYLTGSFLPVAVTTPYWNRRPNSTQTFPNNITIFEDGNSTVWVTVHQNELKGFGGCSIVQAICAIFLILGAGLEKPLMLMPWVIVESLLIVLMFITGIMISTVLLMNAQYVKYGVILLSAVTLVFFISVYFVLVVYSFYQTLSDNRDTRTLVPYSETGRV